MGNFYPQYLDITNESELLNIIQEVQFENPEIRKIEELIHELRIKYINNYISPAKINTDPLMKEISLAFEKAFGFYTFQLAVDQSQFPNAYTCPISSKVDSWNYKKCVKKTNKGLEFTSTAKVNAMGVITTALLLDTKYTDREVVAILLHEIGHNFSDSINNTLGIYSNFKKVLLIPYALRDPITLTNKGREISTNVTRNMRENHKTLVDSFNAVKMFISNVKYVMISLGRFMSVLPQSLVDNFIVFISTAMVGSAVFVITAIPNFFGKEDEYTSDSFVAMYGYGPDLASALIKMEKHAVTPVDEVFKSGTFGALYYAFMVEATDFISTLLTNSHPATANRLLNVLDTLEKEYQKDYINPKLKKETKREIDEVKALIEKEMKEKSFEGNYWRMMWNRFILSRKKTKGPKDKMVEEILDKIENFEG